MKRAAVVLLCVSALSLAACSNREPAAPPAIENGPPLKEIASSTGQPEIQVYKTAACECCKLWVEHLQSHGFPVKVSNVKNLTKIQQQNGVPAELASCHTAKVGEYFIEGHVPAPDIQRLLAEKPRAKGVAVPGMPIGSPGMEVGERTEAYDVLIVGEDGSTSVFAHHPAVEQIVQDGSAPAAPPPAPAQ